MLTRRREGIVAGLIDAMESPTSTTEGVEGAEGVEVPGRRLSDSTHDVESVGWR